MNTKKQALFSVLGIFVLMILTVGVSYAMFDYKEKADITSTGVLKFNYYKDSINITNQVPISDHQGVIQMGNDNVLDFSITAVTDSSSGINYNINAIKTKSSNISEENVKIFLTEVTNTEIANGEGNKTSINGVKFSSLGNINIDGEAGKILYTGKVGKNDKNYSKDFRLRMWIDKDAKINTEIDNFSIKLKVTSNSKVVSTKK